MNQPSDNVSSQATATGPSDPSDPSGQRTLPLSKLSPADNVLALTYGPDLTAEVEGLAQSKRLLEAIIIDCRKSGFVFPLEALLDTASIAMKALDTHGVIAFVTSGKTAVVAKESQLGEMKFYFFDNAAEVRGFSPSLSQHIVNCLGVGVADDGASSDLAEQIVMSSVPILTPFGIKLKVGMQSGKRRNHVLAAIDNYTPLRLLLRKLADRLSQNDVFEELRELEANGAIFPYFAKVPFLVHCFRNKVPFKILDYLVEARLITREQLDEVLFLERSSQGRLSVGAQCVAKGFISARQLEVALHDQAFYGQRSATEKEKLTDTAQEDVVQSLVGYLGTTDAGGILQSLTNNRETGVLSVEHREMQFRALLEGGKLTHARVGKLRGNDAVVEFASVWKEGVFVFTDRPAPSDLCDESSKTTRFLDKLLLDGALASDNIAVVWKKLPKGANTALEKLDDVQNLLSQTLKDPQESYDLNAAEMEAMQRMWKEFDGLDSVANCIKRIGSITTVAAATATNRLLHYQLCRVPPSDLHTPIKKFRDIAAGVSESLGGERTLALLKLSLQATAGYSLRARMFVIGSAGEIGVDMALVKQAGASLTAVTKELDDWQVRFIGFVSQELDKDVLRNIVYSVHQRQ